MYYYHFIRYLLNIEDRIRPIKSENCFVFLQAVPSSLLTPVTIAVRFTYILSWNEEEWVQDPPDFESGFGAEVGYLILSRLPFGPLQDPIR